MSAPIPEDLRELYIASSQRRNRSLESEVSGEDFVLNVNARTHCNLIERIAALQAQVAALSKPVSREELDRPYRGGGPIVGPANRFNAIIAARAALAATEKEP